VDTEPQHLALLRQLRGAYASSTLTLLGIIQGVALAELGTVVFGHYAAFGVIEWLMVAVTFGILIAVWIQIAADTLAWVQVPNLRGSIVTFTVGAMELLLAYGIVLGHGIWLLGLAVIQLLSALGFWVVTELARREPENAALLLRLAPLRRQAEVYGMLGTLLFLLLALADLGGGLRAIDRVVGIQGVALGGTTVLAGIWLVVWLLRSFAYWETVVRYARTGK
jgi:hypothetical protein